MTSKKTGKTIGLVLDGTVNPADFAMVAAAWAKLIQTLTDEADEDRPSVNWLLAEAHAGSFSATFCGQSDTTSGRRAIENVHQRYIHLGEDARQGRLNDYSPQVRKYLDELTSVINGHISAIHLKTDDSDTSITQRIPATDPVWTAPESIETHTYIKGSIRGRLTALSDAQGLQFGLFDQRSGTIIRCYPDEKWAQFIVRNWRKWVVVEGNINRERFSGTAITISDITDIQPIKDSIVGAYRMARGCAPRINGDELTPEDAVRRVRNGER